MDIVEDDDSISLSDPEEEDERPESILKDYLNFRKSTFNPILNIRCGQEVLTDQAAQMNDSENYEEAPTFLNIVQLEKNIPTPSSSSTSTTPSNTNIPSTSTAELKRSTRPQSSSNNDKDKDQGGGLKNINLEMAQTQVQDKNKTKGLLALVSSPLNPDTNPNPTVDIKEKEKEKNVNVNVEPEPHYPMPGRRFLAHQMPVYRPPKRQPNFHTIMTEMEGPLARLRQAIERGKRIKVWTRNESGFRGFTLGFPIAFDKHWNLALKDVDEIIQRKRKGIKLPASASTNTNINTDNVSTTSTSRPLIQKVVPTRSTTSSSSSSSSTKRNQSQRNPTSSTSASSSKNISRKSTTEMSSRPSNFLIDGPDALFTLRFAFEGLSLKVPPLLPATTTITTASKDIKLKEKANKEKESSKILVGLGRRKTRSTTLAENLQKLPAKSIAGTADTTTTSITRSQIKKKGLVIFKKPIVDANGFKIVGHSKKFELIERHCAQQLLFGDNVILIEVDFS